MYQACIVFTPVSAHMLTGSHPMGSVPGHVVLAFSSKEERQEFVESATVWWYVFAEELDFDRPSGAIGQRHLLQNVGMRDPSGQWTKGGAWAAAEAEQAEQALESKQLDADERGDVW